MPTIVAPFPRGEIVRTFGTDYLAPTYLKRKPFKVLWAGHGSTRATVRPQKLGECAGTTGLK